MIKTVINRSIIIASFLELAPYSYHLVHLPVSSQNCFRMITLVLIDQFYTLHMCHSSLEEDPYFGVKRSTVTVTF